MFAKLGANVVVNDFSEKNATTVVDEIKKAGGKAALPSAPLKMVRRLSRLPPTPSARSTSSSTTLVSFVTSPSPPCRTRSGRLFSTPTFAVPTRSATLLGPSSSSRSTAVSSTPPRLLVFTVTSVRPTTRLPRPVSLVSPTRSVSRVRSTTSLPTPLLPTRYCHDCHHLAQEMVDAFKPDYVAPAVGYLASEANTDVTRASSRSLVVGSLLSAGSVPVATPSVTVRLPLLKRSSRSGARSPTTRPTPLGLPAPATRSVTLSQLRSVFGRR